MTKMNSFPDHQAQQRRGKHSDDRRNASTFCASIVTPDRMLPQVEEELQWPTKYTMLQDGALRQPKEYLLQLRKHFHAREDACIERMEYSDGHQNASAIGRSTPTADTLLNDVRGDKNVTNILILTLFGCCVA